MDFTRRLPYCIIPHFDSDCMLTGLSEVMKLDELGAHLKDNSRLPDVTVSSSSY